MNLYRILHCTETCYRFFQFEGDDPRYFDMYEYIGELTAVDPENVFEILNDPSINRPEGFENVRSLSVGDIIYRVVDDRYFTVMNCGYAEVSLKLNCYGHLEFILKEV